MQQVRCKYCRRLLMEVDENTTGFIKIKCIRPTCKRWLELRFPFQSQKASAAAPAQSARTENHIAVTS
jgi:phage FluMu protein Com